MSPPRRRITAKALRYEILVFAEGKVTEEGYLRHHHSRNRSTVNVEIHEFRGDPLSLVRHAMKAKKRGEREEKGRRGRAHDEVWCVFDVDRHPELKHAVSLAREHDIQLAISNPCIELWFLIHFEGQTAFIERHDAQRSASRHTRCEKSLDRDALNALDRNYETAKERARRLARKHEGDGTEFPDDNPSSGVWRIVDSILRSSGS
ncbi:MAG: RloB family protein [Solirubrobacterales bacterium]